MVSGYVTLGVDQAKSSGWAIIADGVVCGVGLAKTPEQRLEAVRYAIASARDHGLPLVAVLEDHTDLPVHLRRGRRNTRSWIGMGDARGRWREILDLHGVRHCEVTSATWRKMVLGKTMKREDAKTAAVYWAELAYGVSACDDEAEAVAIAHWGSKSPEAAELAAMRRKKAVLSCG